ncbi:MAG: hypothetical protein AB1560_06925 [Pseudomonadota bacterium]
MKRTVLVVDDEQNMQTVMRMGEAGFSRTYLTYVRAAERPARDGRAGIIRSRDVAPGTAGQGE